MHFEIVPAHKLSLAEQAATFNQAFAGFLPGWRDMDAAELERFICAKGIDLCHSRFVWANGALAAFGYINRTGNFSRLAGMGTVPELRRIGAAACLLSDLLEGAKARGDAAMVLEVFEQNLPALNLYGRFGFSEVARLFGWRRPGGIALSQAPHEIEEVPVIEAIGMPEVFKYPSNPWQLSRHAAAKVPAGRAFKNTAACVVVGDTTVPPVRIHGFFAAEEDWKTLKSTMGAVIHHFPNREFFAPPIFPERFGFEVFEPLGFRPEALNQLLMRRELS